VDERKVDQILEVIRNMLSIFCDIYNSSVLDWLKSESEVLKTSYGAVHENLG